MLRLLNRIVVDCYFKVFNYVILKKSSANLTTIVSVNRLLLKNAFSVIRGTWFFGRPKKQPEYGYRAGDASRNSKFCRNIDEPVLTEEDSKSRKNSY